MSNDIGLIPIVPELTEQTYELVEALWFAYDSDTCHNYKSLSQAMDSNPDKKMLMSLLEPFKKLGFVKAVHGLMTEDGDVAGSGFTVNGSTAQHLLELAMYRYNYNDRFFGKSEDYVPKTLQVGEHKYKLVVNPTNQSGAEQ